MKNQFVKLLVTITIIILFICPETIVFSISDGREYTGISRVAFEHEEVPAWKTYENKEYHVSLKYPSDWKKNTKYMERYEGADGFFALNAVTGGESLSIDEVVKFSAYHKLMPYGSNPEITSLMVNGQEARLITASSDQSESMRDQSELIVKYPSPASIGGHMFYYFILIADKAHIMDITESIKFLL